MVTACGSLYIGLCLYVDGMVADFRSRIDAIHCHVWEERITDAWLVYVKEFQFHIEIIE